MEEGYKMQPDTIVYQLKPARMEHTSWSAKTGATKLSYMNKKAQEGNDLLLQGCGFNS